jgi:hypothetical protein
MKQSRARGLHPLSVGNGLNFLSRLLLLLYYGNRDNSIGIAIGYGLDDRGSISGSARIFSSGAHPTSYTMGTGGSFLGGKAAGK